MAVIDIETEFTSDNKSDIDDLLSIIHRMAGSLSVAKVDGWHLKGTATFPGDVTTVWSNHIIDVGARTTDGEVHHYWIKESE